MTPFLFDFTLGKPNISLYTETPEAPAKPVITADDLQNRCPYPIPTVEEIIKLIDRATVQKSKDKFLSDLFECGAIAIANQVDFTLKNEREERYLQIIRGYSKPEQEQLTEIFGKIYMLLSSVVYSDGAFNDYLGEIFMRCNLGNPNAGQFFTPYHISRLMALATLDESSVQQKADNDEVITINDPCCGGGGMLVAALDVLNGLGVNYARNCLMDCGDIDLRCVHMTYLQLSLAGVPAIVRHQNALSRELWSVWYTPAFLFQYLRFQKYINLN